MAKLLQFLHFCTQDAVGMVSGGGAGEFAWMLIYMAAGEKL